MPTPSPKINDRAAILEVSGLHVKLAGQTVLSNVSFEIARQNIVAIIGPNGSGKTTLLRAILGLIPHTQGSVLFEGENIKKNTTRVGYLPQKFQFDSQFPINVREFFSLSLKPTHTDDLERKLDEVGLNTSILTKKLGTLSGGELQRVLIAQATLHNPSLLILDEPSTGIDIIGEKQFYELIRSQRDQHGTTIILVSHDIAVIANVVDQVICINKRLICSGSPKMALTQETLSELYGRTDASLYFHHNH